MNTSNIAPQKAMIGIIEVSIIAESLVAGDTVAAPPLPWSSSVSIPSSAAVELVVSSAAVVVTVGKTVTGASDTGVMVGIAVSAADGVLVGTSVVGIEVGDTEGADEVGDIVVGDTVVGNADGSTVVGLVAVGDSVGKGVGAFVGTIVVGIVVGKVVGAFVGAAVVGVDVGGSERGYQ